MKHTSDANCVSLEEAMAELCHVSLFLGGPIASIPALLWHRDLPIGCSCFSPAVLSHMPAKASTCLSHQFSNHMLAKDTNKGSEGVL